MMNMISRRQLERRFERSERLLREEEERRSKVESKMASLKREMEESASSSSNAGAVERELDRVLAAENAAKKEVDNLKVKVS